MMIVPFHAAHTTRRSRELAQRLRNTINEFTAQDSKVTDTDVDAALESLRTPRRNETKVAVAVIAALVSGFVGAGLVVSDRARTGAADTPWLLLFIAALASGIALIIALALSRRSR